jgi:signal transduction histidine kinase/CheY-like chemotaxis protein
MRADEPPATDRPSEAVPAVPTVPAVPDAAPAPVAPEAAPAPANATATTAPSLQSELAAARAETAALQATVQALQADLRQARDDAARARERNAFLESLLDHLPGRVAYWDAGLRLRHANASWFAFNRLDPVASIGQAAHTLRPSFVAPESLVRMTRALEGHAQTYERETWRDDRRQVDLIAHLPDGDEQGRVHGFVVLATDVTELKRTQDALAGARDAADAASRAKSAFLANMSHEIRTPMNAIIGLAHLLRRDALDSLQCDRLDKLGEAAQHLLRLLNDVLDLSKIDAGKLVLERTAFAPELLLGRVLEMVGEPARAKGLELVLDASGLPPRVFGDPTRLSQALLNLLSNAVKFTEQGFVRLRAEPQWRHGEQLQLRIEVHDSGIGIVATDLPRLFTAFEQADASMTRRYGGTGLGLALTRELARLMDGEVGVDSQPGQGSRFWMTLRLGCDAEAQAPLPAPELRGLRALLVDDLPEARAALRDQLEQFGLEVELAADGQDALRRAERALHHGSPHDVALVDWRMPGIDGCETVRRLDALLGHARPPVLLVSAWDEAALRQQAQTLAACSVLIKPVCASVLLDHLLLAVRRHGGVPVPQPGEVDLAERTLRERHAGAHVLLVDDNPVNREVATALLQRAGLRVSTADGGVAALQQLMQHRPDLVLMDVQMPGLDGLGATRALRALPRPWLPVLAMTAHAGDEARRACLAAGMDDHLVKPVEAGTLYARLLHWLAQPAPPVAPVVGPVEPI